MMVTSYCRKKGQHEQRQEIKQQQRWCVSWEKDGHKQLNGTKNEDWRRPWWEVSAKKLAGQIIKNFLFYVKQLGLYPND